MSDLDKIVEEAQRRMMYRSNGSPDDIRREEIRRACQRYAAPLIELLRETQGYMQMQGDLLNEWRQRRDAALTGTAEKGGQP